MRKNLPKPQSDNIYVSNGDVLLDVGCAEALFALDNVDIAGKIYLFEGDEKWIPALNATFRCYKDKVFIINKYLSNVVTETTTTLESAIGGTISQPLFVKMDIEGAEVEVLNGNKDYLQSPPHIKIACCTYHRREDANHIKKIFDELNLNCEFSDGYMYCIWDEDGMKYPYFRHGVIRGWK